MSSIMGAAVALGKHAIMPLAVVVGWAMLQVSIRVATAAPASSASGYTRIHNNKPKGEQQCTTS